MSEHIPPNSFLPGSMPDTETIKKAISRIDGVRLMLEDMRHGEDQSSPAFCAALEWLALELLEAENILAGYGSDTLDPPEC